jgi:hypothetical protein
MAGNSFNPMQTGRPPTEQKNVTWWPFKNRHGSITIPAFGIVSVFPAWNNGPSSADAGPRDGGEIIYGGTIPGTGAERRYAINGPTDVAAGGWGELTFDPHLALHERANDWGTFDPHIGEIWGPIHDEAQAAANCKLNPGYPGFEVCGYRTSTMTPVRYSSRPPWSYMQTIVGSGETINSSTPAILAIAGSAALEANSVLTPGNGLIQATSSRMLFSRQATFHARYIIPISGPVSGAGTNERLAAALQTSPDGSDPWTTVGQSKGMLQITTASALGLSHYSQITGQWTITRTQGTYLRLAAWRDSGSGSYVVAHPDGDVTNFGTLILSPIPSGL